MGGSAAIWKSQSADQGMVTPEEGLRRQPESFEENRERRNRLTSSATAQHIFDGSSGTSKLVPFPFVSKNCVFQMYDRLSFSSAASTSFQSRLRSHSSGRPFH